MVQESGTRRTLTREHETGFRDGRSFRRPIGLAVMGEDDSAAHDDYFTAVMIGERPCRSVRIRHQGIESASDIDSCKRIGGRIDPHCRTGRLGRGGGEGSG